MKTLLVDNYDSFTYNLFQYLGEVNGEPPVVIRNDEMSWEQVAGLKCDNIVISPGPGRPERPKDFGLCRDAILKAEVPVLGVCLGHQGIGHCFGGLVHAAPRPMHGRLSSVYHHGTGLFLGLPSPFEAVRYHSLAVSVEMPGELEMTAWAADGVIMGLAHRNRPIFGVQFHPESICTEHGYHMLRNFRDFSRQRRARSRIALSSQAPLGSDAGTLPGAVKSWRVAVRHLPYFTDPEAVFERCYLNSSAAFFLHSAAIREGMARFSFMGDISGPNGAHVRYRREDGKVIVSSGGGQYEVPGDIYGYLDRRLGGMVVAEDEPKLPFDFVGGFVGYFGYELGCEGKTTSPWQSGEADAQLLFSDRVVVFDHVAQEMCLVALVEAGQPDPAQWFDQVSEAARQGKSASKLAWGTQCEPVEFRIQHDRESYIRKIKEAMYEIEEGETYEVCLTNKVLTEMEVDPFTLYRTLQRINPAPFSSFLKFPGMAVMSSSPERFLRCDRTGRVQAKPIKGTSRRADDPGQDQVLADSLRADEKNRAENLMIVDLLRNDLNRVCSLGSVSVPRLMKVESFATVHQLVSTVEGQLDVERSLVDCIKAAFPGGSMTGAPKVRTMEIIERLEESARGVYSGAIGYLSVNRTMDLSIVIRTIVAVGAHLSVGTGGAIVALSDPEEEFEEILLKANASLRAIARVVRGTTAGPEFVVRGSERISTIGV